MVEISSMRSGLLLGLTFLFLTYGNLYAFGIKEIPRKPAPGTAVSADPFYTGIKSMVSRDKRTAVFFGDGSLRIYAASFDKPEKIIRFFPEYIDFSESGDLDMDGEGNVLFVLKTKKRAVSQLIIYDGKRLNLVDEVHGNVFRHPCFLPETDKLLVALNNNVILYSKDGSVDMNWSLPEIPSVLQPSPDSLGWFAGGINGGLYTSAGESGVTCLSRRDHFSSIITAAYTSSGNFLLTASSDGTVVLWSVKNGESVKSFKLDNPVLSVRVEGESFVTGREGAMHRIDPAKEGISLEPFPPDPAADDRFFLAAGREYPVSAYITEEGILALVKGYPQTGELSGELLLRDFSTLQGISGFTDNSPFPDICGAFLLISDEGEELKLFPADGDCWAIMDTEGFYYTKSLFPLPFLRIRPTGNFPDNGFPLAEEIPEWEYKRQYFRKVSEKDSFSAAPAE